MTRTAISGLALAALFGCAGLIPKDLKYTVHMEPVLPEGRRDYFVDVEDSSFVFSKEGVLVKVRHMTDDELDRRFPPLFDGRHVNPYRHNMKDPETGYIPPRFTVFEVTVVNLTYAKVEFDPAKAVLLTDTGEEHKYYDPGRQGAGPLGGNTFAKYYKTELGISGNEKEIALERMGIVYKTIYHRERPVFKGDQRSGMLVFDPLRKENQEIALSISDFVLSFDASGNPESTVDIRYVLEVDQGVVELSAKQTAMAGG